MEAGKSVQKSLVLLVEDTRIIAELLLYFIRALHQSVTHVQTAEEAVHVSQEEVFDIILMNVGLPYHDGLWATEMIRSHHIHTPIIGYTARTLTNELEQACLDVGMQGLCNTWIYQRDFNAMLNKWSNCSA